MSWATYAVKTGEEDRELEAQARSRTLPQLCVCFPYRLMREIASFCPVDQVAGRLTNACSRGDLVPFFMVQVEVASCNDR